MCYFPDNNFQLIKTNVSSTDWSNNNFCGVKTVQGRSSIPACSAPHTCPAATACEQRLTSDSCGGGGFEFCSTISEAHLFLNIGALRKPFNAVTYQSQKIIIYHHKLLLFLRGVFFSVSLSISACTLCNIPSLLFFFAWFFRHENASRRRGAPQTQENACVLHEAFTLCSQLVWKNKCLCLCGQIFYGLSLSCIYVCVCPCAPVWSSEREMWFNLDK